MCDCGGTRSCTQRAPEASREASTQSPTASTAAAFEQLAGEPGHLAGRAFAEAVVQLHRLAVHGADPQQVEALFAAHGQAAGAFGERRREADALEPIEIDSVEAFGIRSKGDGRAGARTPDRRQTRCRNERCRTRRWAAPDSNDFGGTGLRRPVRSYARIRRLPTRRQEQSQAWSWT